MTLTDKYLEYVQTVRRYSPRTVAIYRDVIDGFAEYSTEGLPEGAAAFSADPALFLKPSLIRSYEVSLLGKGLSPRTVNLHISVLSGLCRYLVKEGTLSANPVKSVVRPKVEKRLPVFYRESSMEEYFRDTQYDASPDQLELLKTFGPFVGKGKPASGTRETAVRMYENRLRRAVVSVLSGTGIRRAELISLDVGSVDFSRRTVKVLGKGNKMREIPLTSSLCEEISLYLQSAESMVGGARSPQSPLFITPGGSRLYPVYVDRLVKKALGEVGSITGRKSPHVLRHTLATELLDNGTDLNSIKELLGHSSLAATQVYTHNSVEKLKNVYANAHPRAKDGGKNGD